jgi:hypothetical protein
VRFSRYRRQRGYARRNPLVAEGIVAFERAAGRDDGCGEPFGFRVGRGAVTLHERQQRERGALRRVTALRVSATSNCGQSSLAARPIHGAYGVENTESTSGNLVWAPMPFLPSSGFCTIPKIRMLCPALYR